MLKTVYACELCGGNCMNCYHSDYCGDWNGTNAGIPCVITRVKSAKMALCEGRHEIPEAVDGAIFEKEITFDTVELEREATNMLSGLEHLDLYVTGATMALIAVLNASRQTGTKVTLWHYNPVAGDYYTQEVR